MLIELSEFNIKLFLPFIFPIFNRIQSYSEDAYVIKDNQLFKAFRYFLSYTFASIFLIIMKIRTRKTDFGKKKSESKNNNEKNEGVIDVILKKEDKKRVVISSIFIALLCGIGMACQFFRKLFEKKEYRYAKQSIGILVDIISLTLFSYFLLGQKLYKHHFISLGIISIFLLIIFIISIYQMTKIFQSFLYYFFYYALFSLYDVLKKKYMIIYFYSPYLIMLVIGSINSFILLIYDIITYYTNRDISGIIIGFSVNINSTGDVFILILDLFLECIWNLGFWLTIYYFSPCYNFISEYIAEYILYITNVIKAEDDKIYSTSNVIIFSICYFINFFFILVFNEVIILNFCGMDLNTKKRIQERVIIESDITDELKNLENLYIDDNEDNQETLN